MAESFEYDLQDLLNFDVDFEFDVETLDSNPLPSKQHESPLGANQKLSKSVIDVALRYPDLSPKKHQLEPSDDFISNDNKKQRSSNHPGASTASSAVTAKKPSQNCKSTSKKGSSLIQPPPPIPRNDIRYTYTRLLLSAFNSCDPVKLHEVLTMYTTEDVVSIHRAEGNRSNPFYQSNSRLDGRQTTIQMWIGLFKAAPDFFFGIRDTRVFHSPDWNVIVASKFDWVGTRVSDVCLTKSLPSTVEEGASKGRGGVNSEEKRIDSSLTQKVVVEPVFQGKAQLQVEQGEEVVLETKPCGERKEMRCHGRLLLHLNEENKITKIEFVYSQSSETDNKTSSSVRPSSSSHK